jgi:aryl-alcohol dehydrogenase-like predicted oxidoreductase
MNFMNNQRKLRKLGNSDLYLSPLGLGCWQFSRRKGFMGNYWSFLNESEIMDIIKHSIEGGINWFDTAEAYGWGESERMLSRALRSLDIPPEKIFIASKWSPIFRTARSIGRTIDERIKALHPYPISLYQIHHPFSFSSIVSQMDEMSRLLKENKIRYVGVSNFSAKQMFKAHRELKKAGYSLVSNQVRYHLLDRRIESNGILETARELGVAIIAYSPLAQGILSGRFHHAPWLLKEISGARKYRSSFQKKNMQKSEAVITLLEQLAEKYRATPAQITLNWLIHFNGEMIFAIPGATKIKQAADNAATLNFTLSSQDLQALGEITRTFK